jgi:hypothetical protein
MDEESIRKAAEAEKQRRMKEAADAVAADFDRRFADFRQMAVDLGINLGELNAKAQSSTANPQPPPVTEAPTASPSPEGPLTLGDLAEGYFSDPNSPVADVKFRTRRNYKSIIALLVRKFGHMKLVEMCHADIQGIHDSWASEGKLAMAHSVVTMLRLLFGSYGSDVLKDPQCQRLSFVLHNMDFPPPKRQTKQKTLSPDDAAAIIREAHKTGFHSIALAQAFQSECRKLQQKDIIGEWLPNGEKGPVSDILHSGKRWVRGLRWSDIDDWTLKNPAKYDLRKCPLVKAELERLPSLPTSSDPIIANDKTGLPWDDNAFRERWRKIADAVGIPKDVKIMDSRAGRKRRARSQEPDEESEDGRPAYA